MLSFEARENLMAWSLATLGAIKSVPELLDPHPEARAQKDNGPSSAKWGWAAIGASVVAWDLFAPETLSEGVDRSLKNHRLATVAAIGTTTLHLLNVLPERIDPIHQVGKRARAKLRSL